MSALNRRAEWQLQLGDYVSTMEVAPDGGLVAAGSLAGDARLIDTASGAVVAKLRDHPLGALAIAWSPAGDRVAVGGQDAVVRLYDRDGTELTSVVADGWADRLAWSPTDDLLAIGGGRRPPLSSGPSPSRSSMICAPWPTTW